MLGVISYFISKLFFIKLKCLHLLDLKSRNTEELNTKREHGIV